MPQVQPKPAKLWKNSKDKKMKKKIKLENADSMEENTSVKDIKAEKKTDTPKENLKRKKQLVDLSPNKKIKTETSDNSPAKIKTKKKIKKATQSDQKDKNSSEKSKKKMKKPDDMTRKDWKMLHFDKYKKGAWKELHMHQKGKSEIIEVGKQLKKLWEELRCEDCQPLRKSDLIKQVCDLLKGRVKEFAYAHDTVRVMESVISLGGDFHRALLFDELKGEILQLVKSKYGKYFLMKMLKYGSKQQKEEIMKAFHGKVIKLLKHAEAATVVELAFNECANATQRFELIQEFFAPSYKYFKVTDVHSLEELLKANPNRKNEIIENMKEELMKVLEKSVVKHSIVHHVVWEFMKHCDETSKSEIIESLNDIVPEILHTKDGSRVGMHCVWYGTIKDRKVIIKSMKKFVTKIAMEEFGHMVLLAIFEAVDDIVVIDKNILKPLKNDLLEVAQNLHGKKVLVHLLSPRDPHFFHPDIINILQNGDGNKNSKKDPEVRQAELKALIVEPMLELIQHSIQEHYTNNAFCLFVYTVLDHIDTNKRGAFQSIAKLVAEPYTTENKNIHPIEHSGSSFLFKKLIIRDQTTLDKDYRFSEILIYRVPKCVMASWIECNRGAFLLVNLIESNIPIVVERVKEELEGRRKILSKKNFEGARILLKKLKSCK